MSFKLTTPAFLLFAVFLVLKLAGAISWSWWWVTCPLWAGVALALAFVAIVLAVALVTFLATIAFLIVTAILDF